MYGTRSISDTTLPYIADIELVDAKNFLTMRGVTIPVLYMSLIRRLSNI